MLERQEVLNQSFVLGIFLSFLQSSSCFSRQHVGPFSTIHKTSPVPALGDSESASSSRYLTVVIMVKACFIIELLFKKSPLHRSSLFITMPCSLHFPNNSLIFANWLSSSSLGRAPIPWHLIGFCPRMRVILNRCIAVSSSRITKESII